MPSGSVDAIERGRRACAEGAWAVADEALNDADTQAPLDAEDLELLATAAYMLGRLEDYLTREHGALLFLLGTAEWRAGQPEAIAHLEQALAAAAEADRADRAVAVLEQAAVAVGDRKATLARSKRLGTIEPQPVRDARLALILEAAIALVGMMNERTAPAALRRAEELRGRLNAIADPPVHLLVMLAYYATRTNRAADAQELAERALACQPYPPPLEISAVLIVTFTIIECYDALQRLCDDLLAVARRDGGTSVGVV